MENQLQNGDGLRGFFQAAAALQERVIETQQAILLRVAQRMADTIRRDGRIFLFGTGHSHMLVEEGFFRAGGLAAVVPIFSSALMLHEHVQLSSRLERTPGVAVDLLNQYPTRPGDMLFVFSNSGVNQIPVEMALAGRERGLWVVGVCSLAYARLAPQSALGKSLDEVADELIDNGGVPGDGLLEVPNTAWRVGSTSTVTGALIWNCLVAETVFQLQRGHYAGALPPGVLPLFASFNMAGGADHNAVVLQQWARRNPHLPGE
jgi:uncharacterized phosphosugar-binding protein